MDPFFFSAKEEAKQEQMEREGVSHAILDQMVKEQLASVVYSLSDDWWDDGDADDEASTWPWVVSGPLYANAVHKDIHTWTCTQSLQYFTNGGSPSPETDGQVKGRQ